MINYTLFSNLIYPQERSEEWKARPLTSESLFLLALGWRTFQVQGLTTISACQHLETPGWRGMLPECVTQPVAESWRFLPANQEYSSTLPTSWMAPWQERAGPGTGSTVPSVWRHRIGLMLSTRLHFLTVFCVPVRIISMSLVSPSPLSDLTSSSGTEKKKAGYF